MLTRAKEATTWERAKAYQQRCSRCEDWERLDLSYFCPTCDAEIAARFDRLHKEDDETERQLVAGLDTLTNRQR